jgi:hypothetical protein
MKVVYITNITPTPDNYKAASALPYHILKYRPAGVEIEAYFFNRNGVSGEKIREIGKDLNMSIKMVESPVWLKWMFKLHLTYLKNFLPYPFEYYVRLPKSVVAEIKQKKPDAIWIWNDNFSYTAKQFPEFRRLLSMPDSVTLYYHRLIGDGLLFGSFYRMMGNCIQYYKNIKMEREYPADDNISYHLVGEVDRQFLLKINPKLNVHFIHHPHYNVSDKKVIKFSQPKIKLLVAGKYDLYMKTGFDAILPYLCSCEDLAEHYSITFLGNGWDFAAERLKKAGYEAQRLGYVDVYLDEIIKYDIQLTPISVGTGTKGKVLDAIANGLLEIGTPYALENVAVEAGKGCLIYNNPEQLVGYLQDIYSNATKYEAMALYGMNELRKNHDRAKVALEVVKLLGYTDHK